MTAIAARARHELIGLRRRHPWLHAARTRTLVLTNTTFVFEAASGDDRLVVALNLDDAPLQVRGAGEVLAGAADAGVVPPHGWAVLR